MIGLHIWNAGSLSIAIGICRLLRLSNSLSASALVMVGAYLTNGWPLPLAVYQAAIAMWCVTAYGYVSNDYTDLAEDQINKPDRPLPAGVIRPVIARNLAFLLALGAMVLSIGLGLLATVVATMVLGLLTLYNYRLKGIPGGGNLVIALLAGSTLWVGSVAVHGLQLKALQPLLPAALILGLFILTREILKTIEDIEGDHISGRQTFAVRWGWHYASYTVIGLALSTLLMIFWSYLYLDYANIYLAIMLGGVGGPLLYMIQDLWRNGKQAEVSRCLALLKGSYFAGILALLAA